MLTSGGGARAGGGRGRLVPFQVAGRTDEDAEHGVEVVVEDELGRHKADEDEEETLDDARDHKNLEQ